MESQQGHECGGSREGPWCECSSTSPCRSSCDVSAPQAGPQASSTDLGPQLRTGQSLSPGRETWEDKEGSSVPAPGPLLQLSPLKDKSSPWLHP